MEVPLSRQRVLAVSGRNQTFNILSVNYSRATFVMCRGNYPELVVLVALGDLISQFNDIKIPYSLTPTYAIRRQVTYWLILPCVQGEMENEQLYMKV
jgi:hypothetical protein